MFKFVPDGVAITMNTRIDDSREGFIIVLCDYVYTGTYLMIDTSSSSSSLASSPKNDETWSAKSWQLSDYQYACLSILGQFTTVEETMHLKGLHHVPTNGTHTFRIDSNGVFSIFIDRKSRLISMFEFKYYVDDHSSSLEGF